MHIKGTEQFEREINLGKRTNSFPKNVSSFLHCFAGGLLLLYALSHFGFLRITGYNGALPNLVFPFLTNNNLYLTAGLLESSVAVVCVGFRGRANTNFVILSFVALMLLYHWAFYFLGGKHCNCLGTLGVLLHVSKSEEKTLTSLSLVFLTLTTTPWIYSNLRVVLMRIFGKMALALMVILIIPQNAHADGELSRVIEIYGTYKGTSQNPITGEPRIDYQHVEAAFHVTICGDDWIITVTNLIDISDHAINYNVSKFSIGQMWCDGTNTYCLQPAHNHEADYNTNVVTITPSRFYTGSYDPDFLGISLPWLTYCLSPSTIQPDKNGVTALPVPWLQPRFSVFAYGYKWIIAATEDGRFIDNLSTVRDTNLDLSDEDSLLRPGFDYPDSLADYDNIKRRLNAFRYVPSGWVQTKFECTEWYHT
ncbi:MAG TPA: hypothetical protein VNN22_16885, partial [Verrucomicrobiae bacterium]|nr:hypothetical protein [Verrucomicrobiae bacterium]